MSRRNSLDTSVQRKLSFGTRWHARRRASCKSLSCVLRIGKVLCVKLTSAVATLVDRHQRCRGLQPPPCPVCDSKIPPIQRTGAMSQHRLSERGERPPKGEPQHPISATETEYFGYEIPEEGVRKAELPQTQRPYRLLRLGVMRLQKNSTRKPTTATSHLARCPL